MIYIFLSLLLSLASYFEEEIVLINKKKFKKSFYLSIYLLIAFVIGSKYQIGVDWISYEKWYLNEDSMLWHANIEKGFKWLLDIISRTTFSYYTANLYITFFSLLILYKFFDKKFGKTLIPLMLYIYNTYLYLLIDQTRQLVALSIILLSLTYFEKKKNIISSAIFASFFHVSSLFLIPFVLISNIKIKKKIVIVVYIFFTIFGMLNLSIAGIMGEILETNNLISGLIVEKIIYYINSRGTNYLFGMYFIKNSIFFIIIMLFSKVTKGLYIWLTIGYFMINLMFYDLPILAKRLSVYLVIGLIYTIYETLLLKREKVKLYRMIIVLVNLYFGIMTLVFMKNKIYINHLLPYKNYYINNKLFGEQDTGRKKTILFWEQVKKRGEEM